MGLKVQPKLKSRKLPKALANLAKLNVELHSIGVEVVKEVRRNCDGRYLKRRTGKLYGAWGYELRPLPHGYRLAVQADLAKAPHARIHDLGGMTGRRHRTRIRATGYALKAWITSRAAIDRIMKKYVVRMFHG